MKTVKKEETKELVQLSEVEKAQKVIQDAQEAKLRQCYAEIQVILDKYSMELKIKADIILNPK